MNFTFSTLFFFVAALTRATLNIRTKSCQEYNIPITVTAPRFAFTGEPFKDNYVMIDFLTNLTSRTASTDFQPFSGSQNVTAKYTISGTFCTPLNPSAAHRKTVLLATHGLGFDRNYWAPAIQPEIYSFVDFAIGKGYSIFYYDRLGVGKSSIVSGYDAQALTQQVILQSLAHSLRAGQYTGSLGVPSKLVLIGHSFGSALSAAALAAEPALAEGLILTGFSYNGTDFDTFVSANGLRIAAGESPKWRQLDTGYIVPIDVFAIVNAFFKRPDYDINVAKFADATKAPLAIAELVTTALINPVPFAFKGAAMVIAGQHDLPFCGSNCDDVISQPATAIFSQAKAFKAVSYPLAGHGLNLATNAPGAYQIITDFLNANGL